MIASRQAIVITIIRLRTVHMILEAQAHSIPEAVHVIVVAGVAIETLREELHTKEVITEATQQ